MGSRFMAGRGSSSIFANGSPIQGAALLQRPIDGSSSERTITPTAHTLQKGQEVVAY
jgi:hypothetical protein